MYHDTSAPRNCVALETFAQTCVVCDGKRWTYGPFSGIYVIAVYVVFYTLAAAADWLITSANRMGLNYTHA